MVLWYPHCLQNFWATFPIHFLIGTSCFCLSSFIFHNKKSEADYIIQQYLSATGIVSKKQQSGNTLSLLTKKKTNMYVRGVVKMVYCETEVSSFATGKNVKCIGGRNASENGCFVVWQMGPSIWSLEMLLTGNKVVAGGD